MSISGQQHPDPPVLDANIVLGWCFGRKIRRDGRALLLSVRRGGAHAPELLRFEVGRVLARRGRGRSLSPARTAWFQAFFAGLPIHYDESGVASQYAAARTLAGETSLTVKDAAYLELAHRLGVPLATRDRPLAAAAERFGVIVV